MKKYFILLFYALLGLQMVNAQTTKKKPIKDNVQSNKTVTSKPLNIKGDVPVFDFPPLGDMDNRKEIELKRNKKVSPKINYSVATPPKFTPEQIQQMSVRSPLIASLTPRTPYYANAMISYGHPFTVSTETNRILLMGDKRQHWQSSLIAHLNLAANKNYLCTVKYQGESWDKTTLTIHQGHEFAQDIHLTYGPSEINTFNFVIHTIEAGWRNVEMGITIQPDQVDMLLYILEWNIKELPE